MTKVAPKELLLLGSLALIMFLNLKHLEFSIGVDFVQTQVKNFQLGESVVVKTSQDHAPLSPLPVVDNNIFDAKQSPDKLSLQGKFIRYQISRDHHYNRSQITAYACRNITTWKPVDDRAELPSSNPFDFYSYIQTNLNILVMGDSLAVEFGSWFQNAGRATTKTVLKHLQFTGHLAEGLVVANVDGGGSIAYWRILGLWERRTLNRPLPNEGKGWNATWASTLRAALPSPSEKINVLIFRVSHPWLGTGEVTTERLMETITVAKMYLGEPLTIIFLTVPLNNNVVTVQNMTSFRAMNKLVSSFVMNLNASDVLLSDVEGYMDNVIEWNANMIGMNTSDPNYFVDERLRIPDLKYRHHVAAVCAKRDSSNMTDCQRNMLLKDGLHFCMESLGPRLYANWACLIQCSSGNPQLLRKCERHCNEKYFRLDEPIVDVEKRIIM